MNNVQDWQNLVGEQVKWELHLKKDGKVYFRIIKGNKSFNVELLPNDATPLLNPLFEKYGQWFTNHEKAVENEFKDVNEGIVLWLQDKYRITPTLRAFTKWFMLNRLNPAMIRLGFDANKETGEVLPQVKIRFDFTTLLESYTPTVIKNDLIEFCKWEEMELDKIDQSVSESNQLKQKIEVLKAAAIAETTELFKGKYRYEPNYQVLLSELNRKFDGYGIKHEIELNSSYIKTGRIKELEQQIHSYLETCQREKGKIIINEGNVVSNCKPPRMALDYCIYSFWELFHTAQLQKLNQHSTKSEEKNKPKEVHAAILFADLENKDWRKFEELENEIAKIKDYTTKKKARVADRDITLQELEYEEAVINSYATQVVEAYPSKGMVFKHVPSLNEKYRRLLAESIADLESLKKIAKARIEANEKKANLEQDQVPTKDIKNNGEYLLGVELLAKVRKAFNNEIWEDANESEFLAVFSVGSTSTLRVMQKQKFYALLKCMYNSSGSTLNQSEWVKPLIDKHDLSLSGFNNIGNKLFNKARKTLNEKDFIKRLRAILPIDEK